MTLTTNRAERHPNTPVDAYKLSEIEVSADEDAGDAASRD